MINSWILRVEIEIAKKEKDVAGGRCDSEARTGLANRGC
jgi:hypothetical protein